MLKQLKIAKFGHYLNTDESMRWYYVGGSSESESTVHLISIEGIATMPFMSLHDGQNANQVRCYYQNSDIKRWIDEIFLIKYFSQVERESILDIYIPSARDIKKWFPDQQSRICIPSNIAKINGAETYRSYDNKYAGTYWLSDSGRKDGYSATVVMADGKIYRSAYLSATNVCVRPVITVKFGGVIRWD